MKTVKPSRWKTKAILLLACFFWAASFIATKKALDSVPPLTVVNLRLLISSICFALWILVRKRGIDFRMSRLGTLVVLSLFGTGLHYGIQTVGLKFTTASNGSVYAVTGPITITLIAAAFLGEKITMKKAAGILVAIIGVGIVMGLDTLLEFDLSGHLLGDLLVFASIFMWGVFTVLGKRMTAVMRPVDMTALITFIGTIYMIPLSAQEFRGSLFQLSHVTMEGWLAIAFLGVFCSFLATLLYIQALSRMESQKVGVYLYTIPPMTCVIAALVLRERMGIRLLIGAAIVLIGVYLTEKG